MGKMDKMEEDCKQAGRDCEADGEEDDCMMAMACACVDAAAKCDESKGEAEKPCRKMVECMDMGVYGAVLEEARKEPKEEGDMMKYFAKAPGAMDEDAALEELGRRGKDMEAGDMKKMEDGCME